MEWTPPGCFVCSVDCTPSSGCCGKPYHPCIPPLQSSPATKGCIHKMFCVCFLVNKTRFYFVFLFTSVLALSWLRSKMGSNSGRPFFVFCCFTPLTSAEASTIMLLSLSLMLSCENPKEESYGQYTGFWSVLLVSYLRRACLLSGLETSTNSLKNSHPTVALPQEVSPQLLLWLVLMIQQTGTGSELISHGRTSKWPCAMCGRTV